MSIRRVQLVAIIVTIASMLVAQEESTAKQNGSISGTVLQAASGRPIAKAKVHLFTGKNLKKVNNILIVNFILALMFFGA